MRAYSLHEIGVLRRASLGGAGTTLICYLMSRFAGATLTTSSSTSEVPGLFGHVPAITQRNTLIEVVMAVVLGWTGVRLCGRLVQSLHEPAGPLPTRRDAMIVIAIGTLFTGVVTSAVFSGFSNWYGGLIYLVFGGIVGASIAALLMLLTVLTTWLGMGLTLFKTWIEARKPWFAGRASMPGSWPAWCSRWSSKLHQYLYPDQTAPKEQPTDD